MTMLKIIALCSLLTVAFSPAVYADCDLFSGKSVMLESQSESESCDFWSNSADLVTSHIMTLGGLIEEDKEEGSYWEEWALKPKDEPLLTQNISTNYIGVGIWMPDDLVEKENEMTSEEWLMNHGLQISLGFGEKKSGEPRMRFDYRWHEVYQGDMMMQIELPF